ncbi:Ribonucleotide reductase of class II (coenzyme B12-dependent) [hydrothermal vent metagenome]|uniref:Vitamin B12-dependent ribonucleotide reductase n=1 Tax=hydrothermal vent metagenome TaxID=652676 RepID=A0A3B1C8S1_9ZZZZ
MNPDSDTQFDGQGQSGDEIDYTGDIVLDKSRKEALVDFEEKDGPSPEELFSENAIRVLERRYLKKDEEGNVVEAPTDMLRRVAKNIAQAEARYGSAEDVACAEEEFYQIMSQLEFMPNSPTLMNAGRGLQQLSACFVLPVEDTMESIFTAVRDTAMIHKSGGGTGFSFSKLRPANSRVRSTNGVSSGPISFMHVFDAATEAIKQGGTRRGANMGILRVDHPDIEAFIDCKRDNKGFTNFNISVALTDSFMDAMKSDSDYDLIDPRTNEVSGSLSAKTMFNKIVSSAWHNGDPGIIFIDRINDHNPTPNAGKVESTNPCGEQPLLPYESCNLGSINLSKMIKDNGEIDWDRLKKVIHTSVRFLDDVIDMNRYPIDKIDQMTKSNRKIGLGIMGWADFLIKLGVPYNSDDAISLAEKTMEFIDTESKKASIELARTRGPFPNFVGSVFDKPGAEKIRNATTTTIAPTGTISIISGCSSGIEPLFALSYIRTVMDKDKLVEINPLFERVAKDRNFYSEELMEKVAYQGHIEGIENISDDLKKLFVTAHGVTPEWHIKMQAAFQKHTDNAVSKTVNFPSSAKQSDVYDVYISAYDFGCKGVTIYRDGSRDEQVLSTGSTNDKAKDNGDKIETVAAKVKPRPRPDIVFGSTQRINTGCGYIYVTVNHDETGRPFELFTAIGKAGGCAASQTESIGRLVSLAMRAGIDVDEIRTQLMGISCHQPAWEKGMRISSCADAISKALKQLTQFHPGNLIPEVSDDPEAGVKPDGNGGAMKKSPMAASLLEMKDLSPVGACPDCGSGLQPVDGCLLCHSCGYSKC